jgi:predicted O-linked N-acetylglucosamine transferase (SPINDLY family)
MSSIAEQFAAAITDHQQGLLDRAEATYLAILKHEPEHDGAWHLLGVIHHQRGRDDLAVERIGRAIALNRNKGIYHNNYGVALRGLGRIHDAIDAYREALRINPRYPDALTNLATALHLTGQLDEARKYFEEALRLQPAHADALFNFANLLSDVGQLKRAIELYEQANKVAPARTDILNSLGNALLADGRSDEGLSAYKAALAVDPDHALTVHNLGSSLVGLDRIEEAPAWFADAMVQRPHPAIWSVRYAALCPIVFQTTAAIDQHRAALEQVLDEHQGAGLAWDLSTPTIAGCCPSFGLAHHGHDDLQIRSKFARLFRANPTRPRGKQSAGPPRIGFVVTDPHESAFLRCMSGLINQVTPGRFAMTMFAAERAMRAIKSALRHSDLEFITLPDRLATAAERIAAATCDLLYHWEVGTDWFNYLLPFARSAPAQCTSWGIQVTTGVPAIDYYLSSDLVETPGAEAHYSETLVRLPTLLSYQTRAPRPDRPADAREFGLPTGRTLYACLQRPNKIHPDFDALLAGILRGDPRGIVVLLKGRSEPLGARLNARFHATMPDVADRIVLLPWMSADTYRRLLALSYVVLDPIPYGSGSSCYDIFSLNRPLITFPGPYNASRYALACYRKMELMDLVARSAEEYVALALRIGTESDFRAETVARLTRASHALFEDIGVVRAHEAFFEGAIARTS